jgi:rare lipoprotein A (peptidoglycan hydrolase)
VTAAVETRHVVTRHVVRWTVPIALVVDHAPTTTGTTTTTTIPLVVAVAATARQAPVPATPTTTTTTSTTTTTTTVPPPPAPVYERTGLASWYPEARLGYCASPYLFFGTVLTVTDVSTGVSIQCTVDDRQAKNLPRVVDLSYQGFEELDDPSIGLIEVRLSW